MSESDFDVEVEMSISKASNNRFDVNPRTWSSWSPLARRTFNNVYNCMCESQWMFLHPGVEESPDKVWSTTAWNAAWTAAEVVRHNEVR